MKKSVGAIFFCGEEVFFIRRQDSLRAFPGYISFPGGKVDRDDATLEDALFREVHEEVGIDLKELQKKEVVEKICPMGVAISPDFNPERFETHFFKIVLKKKIEFNPDCREISEAQWAIPSRVLSWYEEGRMLMVPPTLRIFEVLDKDRNAEWVEKLNYEYDREREVPVVECLSGVMQLMPLSPTLPPADRTNAFLIGDGKNCILVDPSPVDKREWDKLKRTLDSVLKGRRIEQIFLTHHHQDHHHLAPLLAEELGATFLLSEDTHGRILSKWGANYFRGITCRYKKQGDEVVKWRGESVIVHEVPGHDQGQLALIPESCLWAIVGDLIQTVGTVVIASPEGNMQEYFQSLKRMINLSPKAVFPSHGVPLGGVEKLRETLEHRRGRERQICELLGRGASEEEIFTEIYPHLPANLHTAAQQTIRAHILKIERS